MAVYISDKTELEKKIKKLKTNIKNLYIISDFDRTLTKAFVSGIKVHTLFGQLLDYLGKNYNNIFEKAYEKYHPIEISSLPVEEKIPKMIEWWNLLFNAAIEDGVSRKIIDDIVKSNNIHLRDGAVEFFSKVNKNNIPLLIFSAGLGDIISEFLKSKKAYSPNIHIISNFFTWKNGKATGIKLPLVHSFNKNELLIKNSSYFPVIEKRKNVILLGDLIEDVKMAEGLNHDCVIKIGFMNSGNLTNFQKVYDVVITEDGSFEQVNKILDKIIIQY